MSARNDSGMKRVAIDNTSSDCITAEPSRYYLRAFNELPKDESEILFMLLQDAYNDVLQTSIENKVPFSMPFVGKILIKEGKLIDLESRDAVADKYGYKSFNDIPKDIYDEAKAELSSIVTSKFIKAKAAKKKRREAPYVPYKLKTGSGGNKAFIDVNKLNLKTNTKCIKK